MCIIKFCFTKISNALISKFNLSDKINEGGTLRCEVQLSFFWGAYFLLPVL